MSVEVSDALPKGIRWVSNALRGIPEQTGTWEYSITAQDELGQKLAHRFRLTVLPPPALPLRIVPRLLSPAFLNVPYLAVLTAEGGSPPYRWEFVDSELPSWAKLIEDTITGQPASAEAVGEHEFRVRVIDAANGQTEPARFRLSVVPNPNLPPPRIGSNELPPAIVGVPYRLSLPVSGGLPPYTILADPVRSPLNLEITADGHIGGVPTQAGQWRLSVRVRDSLGQLDNGGRPTEVVVPIVKPPPSDLEIVTDAIPHAVIGQPYAAPLQAVGGYSPYTWKLAAGQLPDWAQLESNTVVGTPPDCNAMGKCSFSVEVQDARSNRRGPQELVLRVERNLAFPGPIVTMTPLPAGTVDSAYDTTQVYSPPRCPVIWNCPYL